MSSTPEFELGNDGPMVIVVGVDGSEASLRAGAYAAGLARRQRCRLVAGYVLTPPGLSGLTAAAMGAVVETREQVAQALFDEFAEVAAELGVEADLRLLHGEPYAELHRLADEVRADAVVVGASASAGHRLVGSTAVRLVRAGRWPVTVVP